MWRVTKPTQMLIWERGGMCFLRTRDAITSLAQPKRLHIPHSMSKTHAHMSHNTLCDLTADGNTNTPPADVVRDLTRRMCRHIYLFQTGVTIACDHAVPWLHRVMHPQWVWISFGSAKCSNYPSMGQFQTMGKNSCIFGGTLWTYPPTQHVSNPATTYGDPPRPLQRSSDTTPRPSNAFAKNLT